MTLLLALFRRKAAPALRWRVVSKEHDICLLDKNCLLEFLGVEMINNLILSAPSPPKAGRFFDFFGC